MTRTIARRVIERDKAGVSEGSCNLNKTTTIGSEMKVGVSSFASWMLGVGAVIGSYAWLIHGPMIARAGTLPSICAFIIAAFMTIPAAFILAELSSMFPTAGGPYIYKYYAFKRLVPGAGELIGFVTGWLFYICIITGLACMANGLTNLLSTCIFGAPHNGPVWFSPLVIFVLFGCCTILNMVSVSKASLINNCVTILKFVMAIAFGALVFSSPNISIEHALTVASPSGSTNFWTNVSAVFLLALSGYGGVEICACSSSETANARRNVPRAIFLTVLSVAFFYVLMCISVSVVSPYALGVNGTTAVIAGTETQATCPALASYLGGSLWGTVMTAAVVASIVGCGFSCLLNVARVGYSMAATGLFPQQFAQLHPKTKVPQYALWFQMWCLIIVSLGANVAARTGLCPDAYVFMGEVFGFMYSFLALLYGFCLIALRYTDPDMARPFRIGKTGNRLAWFLAAWAGVVYGFAAFVCTRWVEQVTGVVLLLVGIPIYLFYKRQGTRKAAAQLEPVSA